MKTRNLVIIFAVAFLFPGCVIWSFYPLYTEKDLFENDILTGSWTDGESLNWSFEHPKNDGKSGELDKTRYVLSYTDCDSAHTTYDVRVVKLNEIYFLDFYLTEISTPGSEAAAANKNFSLWSLHILPVHTFAKLTFTNDSLQINWFDGDWLQKQIEGKKIKIRHEKNDEYLLLTAKTESLQKLVVKYANTPAAFKDGASLKLLKK